ncbi:hypothetical protein V1318_07600 [Lysobacter sp. CCNWLW3]|uniref:hypothetical protein n=1 Tax=unclassified Lysobacter TaxID=2635362 RepID=UPI002FD11A8D
MNKLILAAGLFALAPVLSSTADAAGRGARGELVYQIVKKWGPYVQETYRADIGAWSKEMGQSFAKAPMDSLQAAADARSFDAMNAALTGETLVSKADVQPTALGDAATDLVFVPITPCRLFDTRLAGGPIPAFTVRSFDVTAVSDYSFQGGHASNCNGVGAAGSFGAAVINFTVVFPAGPGHLITWPFGRPQPDTATLNFAAGDVRGNLSTVALDQGASANELSVYTTAQTHLVGDIVGYFINPGPLLLQCVDSGTTDTPVAAGATANSVAPACPSTHPMQTATNCQSSTWQMPFVFFSGGVCSAQNNSAGAATLRSSRTCCRVVGS